MTVLAFEVQPVNIIKQGVIEGLKVLVCQFVCIDVEHPLSKDFVHACGEVIALAFSLEGVECWNLES